MRIEFAVSCASHMFGSTLSNMNPKRFNSYDEAFHYGHEIEEGCYPTVYCIVDGKYILNCQRCEFDNVPYKVYKYESLEHGYIETAVWWEDFVKNPEEFLYLAINIGKE